MFGEGKGPNKVITDNMLRWYEHFSKRKNIHINNECVGQLEDREKCELLVKRRLWVLEV